MRFDEITDDGAGGTLGVKDAIDAGTGGTDSSSSRFDPAQRLSPSVFEQNATMKDSSVHEYPSLLKVGVRRNVTAALGTPNQIIYQGGQEQDVYEFNPDGPKFVKPKTYARNIAAGVFTGGIATVVHQARVHPPSSSSPYITSRMDLMASCSRFKRNRVAMTERRRPRE
jgi:hypothetical protein